ncbi:MAG: hypothetical protein H0A76_07555 [Candidatus Thiodubiliella endoseptemdiera]|uniref:Uncharacterized protein n=2 Tax=Candidatus Thiodubiliella endoseptemdiera TaxID=2738886 RepID=A0A853F1J0_9GAMM|nr:hypothetical protein [Candidatus Thiodubiliella endoseptemdiera]
MNNHQNAIFHQITNFLKTPLALLGVDLKNFQFNKICHFANHPYLCKGLLILKKHLFMTVTVVDKIKAVCMVLNERANLFAVQQITTKSKPSF